MIKTKHPFEPLHFLNALGAGGLATTFFMYLMFLTSHPNTPIPTFESIMLAFSAGGLLLKSTIVIAYVGIVIFTFYHLLLVIKKLSLFLEFKKTSGYSDLFKTNKEAQLLAIPLTVAMSFNVLFVSIAVFVPGFWGVKELIFPVAVFGFLVTGFYAFKMISRYYTRLFLTGDFDFETNNNFSQILPLFALAMVGVGLSGPAAMSSVKATAAVATIASMSIFSVAVILFALKFILGFKSSLKKGWSFENSPSLWIMIPFLTLFGIALIRYQHAFHTILHSTVDKGSYFFITVPIVAVQIFFALLGYKLMKANGYFQDFTKGEKSSVGSLALICPGVAGVVFGFFFLGRGLVDNGIIAKFGPAYFVILTLLILLQLKTIQVYLRLNRKLIERS